MRRKGTYGAKLPNEGYYGSLSDDAERSYADWKERYAKPTWPLWMIRARYINYCRSWRAQHDK